MKKIFILEFIYKFLRNNKSAFLSLEERNAWQRKNRRPPVFFASNKK